MTPDPREEALAKAREALELGRNVAHRLLDYNNTYDKEAANEFLEALAALSALPEGAPPTEAKLEILHHSLSAPPFQSEVDCTTCRDDPDVCATIPMRHCAKANAEAAPPSQSESDDEKLVEAMAKAAQQWVAIGDHNWVNRWMAEALVIARKALTPSSTPYVRPAADDTAELELETLKEDIKEEVRKWFGDEGPNDLLECVKQLVADVIKLAREPLHADEMKDAWDEAVLNSPKSAQQRRSRRRLSE